MRFSIIIPVKEINGYIKQSNEHIRRLDYDDYEVIVYPDKDSEIMLHNTKVIPTGPIGPAEKRDLAIRHATGEVLAFLDDDAYPRHDWLKNAATHFMDENVAAVGGPAVTPYNNSKLQKASGAVFSSRLTSSNYIYRYIPSYRRDVDDFPTVNLFVRKDVFEELGGFDTAYWPGEDTKLCLDITKKLGLKIVYDPEVLVYHHRRPLFLPHLKQVSRYALQRGYFVKAFPDTSLKAGYFIPSLFLLFIIAGFFVPVVSKTAFIAWSGVFSIYLAALLTASLMAVISYRDITVGVITFIGIFLTHITYGFNFIRGLLLKRKGIEVAG
ncbi:MAG: glycosyltransferase [Deltaproteobacteria bacterium]|nr:glycosyltransferase [Deltaproteobacteria bacterium]